MGEIEVAVKSLLPADEAQGVYHIRINRKETVGKLLRTLCQQTHSVLKDDYCLRSKEHELLNREDVIADVCLHDGVFLHWTRETAINTPGISCNIFYFLALLGIIIGIVGIVSLCVIKFKKKDPVIDYAVIFDAGSTHTSAFIYKWDGSKVKGTAVAIQAGDTCKVDGGGISSYVDHPERAGQSLEKCLKKAKDMIPSNKHFSTPVYLGATAGMRLLNISNPKAADAIMNSVRSTLKTSSLKFLSDNNVRIISGYEEGTFSWISSNYLTNAFQVLQYRLNNGGKVPAKTIVKAFGAMDLGGASTQITFIPADNATMPPGYSNELRLFGHDYSLYTHSYLCNGISEVQRRIKAYLVNNAPNTDIDIEHACLPLGYNRTENWKDIFESACVNGDTASDIFGLKFQPLNGHVEVDSNYTFKGTSDPLGCENLIKTVIINSSIPCKYPRCSFNGVYQPKLKGTFYAFSGYYYVTRFFNLTKPTKTYMNYSDFTDASDRICNMSWVQLKTLSKQLNFLPQYCGQSVYIKLLLTRYGFDETNWPTIHFVGKISSTDVGWSLGFVLNESNNYPVDKPEVVLYTVTFSLLMVLFILFILVSIIFICHGKRVRKSITLKQDSDSYGAI